MRPTRANDRDAAVDRGSPREFFLVNILPSTESQQFFFTKIAELGR